MAARGKTPDFALAVEVEEAFFHCSKCIIRSSLWIPEAWPSLDGLPSLAQTMVDAAALPMPVEALAEIIKQDESERLTRSTLVGKRLPPLNRRYSPLHFPRPDAVEGWSLKVSGASWTPTSTRSTWKIVRPPISVDSM